jgi:hypothetical protein
MRKHDNSIRTMASHRSKKRGESYSGRGVGWGGWGYVKRFIFTTFGATKVQAKKQIKLALILQPSIRGCYKGL